jgi:hypothetical protein
MSGAASAEAVWGVNTVHEVLRGERPAGAGVPIPAQPLGALAVGANGVWGLSRSRPPLQ